MRSRRRFLAGLMAAAAALLVQAAASEAPDAWLNRVWAEFFAALRASPPRDTAQAQALLERQLVPLLDVEALARRIVADAWTQATPAARRELVAALRLALPRRHAPALLRLRPMNLQVLYSRRPAPGSAEVYAWVQAASLQAPLRFALVDNGQGWRAADVTVLAFSLSQSLRAELLPALRQGGVAAAARALAKSAPG
jgi:ABC-type transporter MlaC component